MKSQPLFIYLKFFIAFIIIFLVIYCTKKEDNSDAKEIGFPVLTTKEVTDITQATAVSGGVISSDGGAIIKERGVCWSRRETPTISDSKTVDGGGIGQFSSSLSDLSPETTYYVRAYATNSFATGYGAAVSFTTPVIIFKNCGDDVRFVYNGQVVTYGTVKSNGRCWLDRNLGAIRVAENAYDNFAFGHLFQWGRADDGHQVRTSSTNSNLSNTDSTGHAHFIATMQNIPYDWRSPQNDSLWQGVNGINNPCPPGWRLPTIVEWNAERQSWSSNNAAGAFNSPLKLTMGGYRHFSNGSLIDNPYGVYWSSTVSANQARYLYFYDKNALLYSTFRAFGYAVRCIKD